MTEKVLDETLLATLKDVLLRKRGEILSSSTGTRPLPASADVNSRQGDLADRPVALKVSAELFGEPQALAQLQHTHIVPIYSTHRVGRLRAVCMPYFGATTLEVDLQ